MRKEPFIVDLLKYQDVFNVWDPQSSFDCNISEMPSASNQNNMVDIPAIYFDSIYMKSMEFAMQFIDDPEFSFFGRVKGEMANETKIRDGNMVVIDRSIVPKIGKMAVYLYNGDFVLRRIESGNNLEVWGVCSHLVSNSQSSLN